MFGDATVDVSTVRRWVRHCKEAEGETGWLTKRGVVHRPATAFYRAGIHALVKRWTKTSMLWFSSYVIGFEFT